MKKDQVFTDEHGVRWVTAAKVAEMWNAEALKRGIEANYTRWSVYARRNDIPFLDTPLGRLFREDKATEISLRPRATTREDTTERNVRRRQKKSGDDSDGLAGGSSRVVLRAVSSFAVAV